MQQTVSLTSILEDDSASSIKFQRAMKVPVRPMPALQCTVIAEKDAVGSLLTACKKVTKEMGDLGTPLSGQEVKWYNRMRRPLLGFESDGEDDEVEEEAPVAPDASTS